MHIKKNNINLKIQETEKKIIFKNQIKIKNIKVQKQKYHHQYQKNNNLINNNNMLE